MQNCRLILERFIDQSPEPHSYIKAAKFEEQQKNYTGARLLYERGLAELGRAAFQSESLFAAFAQFEIRQKEYLRARKLFEFGIDKLPKDKAAKLVEMQATFQRQFGTREEVETVVLNQRRDVLE